MDQPHVTAPLPPSEEQASPLRVLLVEDSSDWALLVEEMLREALPEGVELRRLATVAAARAELAEHQPDCVLLDLGLADAAGLEGLARLQEAAPQVPVVVLSGQDREEVAVQAVQEGAQDYIVKHHAEGRLLARSIRYAMQRKRAELELQRQALHDPLTGLPNRLLLLDRLSLALARAQRAEHAVAVLFCDLDRFKLVNDSLGHDAGDRLLVLVAQRLESLIRPSDTVARFGGDEFMVLCDEIGAEREAVLIAERLSAGMADPFSVYGRDLEVGMSIGVAFGRDQSGSPESLIRDADQAMYRAKEHGARFELADERAMARSVKRLSLESELHRALENEELLLHYQPEVDLHENRVFGVEALLRWEHPTRGLLAPGEFIPLAEESGLIVPIGRWVIGEACRQLADWRGAGSCASDLTVSVNLSLRQLSDSMLAACIVEGIEANHLTPESLCLEITESVVAGDSGRVVERLEELRRLGVLLSLDDFGTGVSSLSVLDRYPLDMLKIDRSFVSRLSNGLRAKRLFAAVLGAAHSMELRAVAEGVETRDQLTDVAHMGCDAAQGFLLFRPGPADVVAPALGRPPVSERI